MKYVARIALAILLAASVDIGLYRVARQPSRPLGGGGCFGYTQSAAEKRAAQDQRNAWFLAGMLVSAAAIAFIRATVVRFADERFRRPGAAYRRTPLVPLLGTAIGCVSLTLWLGISYWLETAGRRIELVTLEPVSPQLPFVWIRALTPSELAERDSLNPIASAPPYPKALVEDECFDLGTVRSGGRMPHHVCIKNVGDAPLILTKPGWHRELKVGEAFDYEMSFRIPEEGGFFANAEVLWTNDPQRREIRVVVVGVSVRD